METKSFQIQIPTKTLTETNVAVITTVGVISSFFIGMSFLFAAAQLNPINENPEPVINQPMLVSDVTAVGLERTQKYPGSLGIFLESTNGTLFGIINQGGNLNDGNKSAVPAPLWVGVNSPNDAIALSLATPEGTKNICIPENTTWVAASNDGFSLIKTAHAQVFIGRKYFVDERGNTYADAALTQKLNTGDCTMNVAKGLTPASILGGAMTPTSSTPLVTNVEFFRGNMIAMGSWGGLISTFQNQVSLPSGNYPLHLYFQANGTTDPQILPASVITLSTDKGTYNLCFPQTTIQGLGTDPQYLYRVDYFYDIMGNAYKDATLTQRVSTTNCTAYLGKTFIPNTIVSGSLNTAYALVNTTRPTFGIFRDGARLGELDGNGIQVNPKNENKPAVGSKSPLYIDFTNGITSVDSKPVTLPVRLLTLTTTSDMTATSASVTKTTPLCVPSVTLPPLSPNNSITKHVYIYYDANGKPYSDSLLTSAMACSVTPSCQCIKGIESCCVTNTNPGGSL